MILNNPNRFRSQVAKMDRIMQKKSGDQHIQPQDDTEDSPHRPHRVNREDMQKFVQTPPDRDES